MNDRSLETTNLTLDSGETMSSDPPLQLNIIIGSTREGRLAPSVARWFLDRARLREDLSAEVTDLAKIQLPDVLSAHPPPALELVSPALARADAFVIVTPEYNHSFPAPLKTLIDWHHEEWHAKPVGFVSYGGRSGGIRAVEQLRQVFAELHAVTVRDGVSFPDVWKRFDNGVPRDVAGTNQAADTMLGQLVWWGRALREARANAPYMA